MLLVGESDWLTHAGKGFTLLSEIRWAKLMK